jgi:hypothetical protein
MWTYEHLSAGDNALLGYVVIAVVELDLDDPRRQPQKLYKVDL